jgi:vacuolar-type H+-ATPase subunit H
VARHLRRRPLEATREQSDLSRLLEAEARLEQMLRDAREEAARLVAEAHQAAQARDDALEADLEGAGQRLEAEIAAERERRVQEIVEGGRREVERLEHVAPERIKELARYVVDRVIEGGS